MLFYYHHVLAVLNIISDKYASKTVFWASFLYNCYGYCCILIHYILSKNLVDQFSPSVLSDSLWPHGLHEASQASLSITSSQSLLKLMPVESGMPSNHLIFLRPLLLPPSIFPNIRGFSNESALCITWPKYWRFSFSPSDEYSGLISFRIDWFDLLAV